MGKLQKFGLAAGLLAAATGLGTSGLVALPGRVLAASSVSSIHSSAWFHDPVSAAARRTEIAVPTDPSADAGALRHTKATFRTAGGRIAVPVTWAYGHVVVSGQALALTDRSLFAYNRSTLSSVAVAELGRLSPSLSHVRAVTCEGNTDFGGIVSYQHRLSVARAAAVCARIHAERPGIDTTSVGDGGTDPVVVGATSALRVQNRRVVIVVTASAPLTTTPGAPHLTRAVAGNTTATVTFSAPAATGGTRITGYRVSIDGGATWRGVATTGASPYTVTLHGLTDGDTYPVAVRAVNADGHGRDSNRLDVTPRAPAVPPGAPTLVAVSAGDTTATATFDAPVADGGTAIRGYQASTDGGTTWEAATTSGTGPYTTTLTGLTDGTAYPVTVRAVNGAGDGPASNRLVVTPAAVPGAPDLTGATGGFFDATLTFTAPRSDGGAAITGYEATIDGGTSWSELTTSGDGPDYTSVLTGLGNYDTYTVTVRAVNRVGDSLPSNSTSFTTLFGCDGVGPRVPEGPAC